MVSLAVNYWGLWLCLFVLFGGYVALNDCKGFREFIGPMKANKIFDKYALTFSLFAGIICAIFLVTALGAGIARLSVNTARAIGGVFNTEISVKSGK